MDCARLDRGVNLVLALPILPGCGDVAGNMSAAHTNRLIREKSPYLLQHAHNPVDWHAWGEEAFEKARREEKPIFLSVGYSTCHWCHVMERESFENEETARVLNEHFVPVKVDREETAGRGPGVHDIRAGDDRERRLAHERVADAGAGAVRRGDLFSAGGPVWAARFPTVLRRLAQVWRDGAGG